MADFKNTLKNIIEQKAQNTPQLRQAIYQKARKNLSQILEKQEYNEDKKQQKINDLEQDILQLENEYVIQQKASILDFNTKRHNLQLKIALQKNDDRAYQTHKSHDNKITKLFDHIKKQEIRQRNKKNLFNLFLGSLFSFIFIFSCVGIAWHFLASRNRNAVNHEIINTKIDTGISSEKFDGRLINEDEKKHNTPTMVTMNKETPYDIASYSNKAGGEKIANITWSIIKNPIPHKDIINAKINVIDSEAKLSFDLEHNLDKSFKGAYAIKLTYNDENIKDLIANKTDITFLKDNNRIKLASIHKYNPTKHITIFSFDDIEQNLQKIKQADAAEINFAYKNAKNVLIKFTKNKNAKEFFSEFT